MNSTGPVLVLHVAGTLGAMGVRALQQRLDAENGAQTVVVDLGTARKLHHVALAILAHDLQRRVRPRVVLRGLEEHHVRLLRCFGLDLRDGQVTPTARA
jgi:hypothetical protein